MSASKTNETSAKKTAVKKAAASGSKVAKQAGEADVKAEKAVKKTAAGGKAVKDAGKPGAAAKESGATQLAGKTRRAAAELAADNVTVAKPKKAATKKAGGDSVKVAGSVASDDAVTAPVKVAGKPAASAPKALRRAVREPDTSPPSTPTVAEPVSSLDSGASTPASSDPVSDMSQQNPAPPTDLDLDAIVRDVDLDALLVARHPDPFRVLGVRDAGHGAALRVFVPGASAVAFTPAGGSEPTPLLAVRDGLFIGACNEQGPHYQLHISWPEGHFVTEDSYAFAPIISEDDLTALAEGRHPRPENVLGAHVDTLEGVDGVRFAVWAPNAQRVSVIGDFNGWDGRRHPMRLRHRAGVWEIFVPRATAGARYKFELVSAQGELLPARADPMARRSELAPATASIVAQPDTYVWQDAEWMAHREGRHAVTAPLSIYEVHLGSWLHDDVRPGHAWDDLGDRLIEYVRAMGFTHIELMPIMEHPFGGSWGYQPLGMFAPTARYGTPERFAAFVDRCHQAGIGVILDWVPAHFPNDAHGLTLFDGTALYEYADPREGFHPDWNTMIYNLGRNEVRNFMIASGLFWLREFHIDGLRVDAVASMLYRDYSRKAGEWIPNQYGGRENLESVDFLRALNTIVRREVPGAMMIAEESTAWPGVTDLAENGGLGFHYKWNMGWMHDTLKYVECEPIYRQHHHNDLTFGMVYAYSEKFILPLSHDEIVHGKGSLLAKMPGDNWQKFATLRAYFGFMFTHPGKKLLFMGNELAQGHEWNHDGQLDWNALNDPLHQGVQSTVRDLNHLYRELPALHCHDCDPSGFAWVIGDDAQNSVAAYLRLQGDAVVLVVCNMTPVPREGYRIGVPHGGRWVERLNTDASLYGGSGMGNAGAAHTDDVAAHGQPHSVSLVLPPLSTLIFEYQR